MMRHHVGVATVNEHTGVPRLDTGARKRLATALERDGVVAGSLFGSQAVGEPGPLSDVDVAVWVEGALKPRERGALRLELADAAARALGTDQVDLVVLNDAPPLLRHRAVRDGEVLVERDRLAHVRLATTALLEYLDTEPLRATLAAGRRRRLAEDRFGRR